MRLAGRALFVRLARAAIVALGAGALATFLQAPVWAQAPAPPSSDSPETPAPTSSWWSRPALLGDLGGLRPRLADLGITPTLQWVSDIQGNPVGGEGQGIREFEDWFFDLNVDLGKRAGLPGATLDVSASVRSGSSLSNDLIGNVFNVAQTCCGATYRLVGLSYQQALSDDRLNLQVGRIAATDDFLTSPLYELFVNSGINDFPGGLALNAPGLTSYPVATWGARARVRPVESLSVTGGVFNGDASLGDNDKHGVDFSLRGPVFALVEVGYRLNQEKVATGLPGNYKIGAWYDDHRFTRFSSVGQTGPEHGQRGNAGIFLLVDQMVYRAGAEGSLQSLTPFASLLLSPDDDVSTMPVFVNGGLVAQGLWPGRDADRALFGVVYGRFSDRLAASQRRTGALPQDYELVLEWGYIIQVTPWLQVEPDVQYIVNPGGTGRTPDAVVLGFQLSVTF